MSPSVHTDSEFRVAVANLQRQRRHARIAVWMLVLVMFAIVIFLGQWMWLWLPVGVVLALVNGALQIRAFTQMCPRCNSPLTEEHGWWRILPPACPSCQLAIEQSAATEQLSNGR